MNSGIETVGDLIEALQRFDAALPVRYVEEHYFGERLWSPDVGISKVSCVAEDRDGNLKEGDEFVQL